MILLGSLAAAGAAILAIYGLWRHKEFSAVGALALSAPGLAICCSVLGHPFIAVMRAGNSRERARMMAAPGAEVVLVPQAPGGTPGQVTGADLSLVEAEAQRITAIRDAFRADQFRHPGNPAAHEAGPRPNCGCDRQGP
ncbi:pyridoxal-phosphate dependent enzyme [Microvirga yunnanensis]|uniref:pyridoxal-phosphate dependent enzyme n=1 Tax=Microvirga yunnanensis TaxID=2953740 RepID=UPI0035A0DCCC